MSIALCFQCGDLKTGVFGPCDHCDNGPTPDQELNLLFSNQRMDASALRRFGQLIKEINRQTEQADIRFWAFMTLVSRRADKIVAKQPPQVLARSVQRITERIAVPDFPIVLKHTAKAQSPPQMTVNLPASLYFSFRMHYSDRDSDQVEIRTHERQTIRCRLRDESGVGKVQLESTHLLRTADIVAVRPAPRNWFDRVRPATWIEFAEEYLR